MEINDIQSRSRETLHIVIVWGVRCNSRYPECPDSCQEPPLSSKDPTLRDGGQGNLDRLSELSWQFGAR